MKITDNLGRSVDVALVAKPALSSKFSAGLEWTRPHFYEIANNSKLFVRMPVGQFALRVMSAHKTEILVHVDGKLRARTVVATGLQYVDKDDAGNFFIFAAPGDEKQFIPASDQALIQAPEVGGEAAQPALFSEDVDQNVQMPMLPVSDPGSVFVVLRFVHSGVHVTSNDLRWRFSAFMAGAVVLMAMWIYFALKLFLAI